MSFNLEQGLPIATVKGGDADGEFVFLDKENKSGDKSFTIRNGKFQRLPNYLMRVHYICGPAGVGKSTRCAEYMKWYKKLNPENRIILLSRVDDDPAFEGIDYKRLMLTNSMADIPMQIEEIGSDCLCVFDDLDTISSKKLIKSVYNFERQILELGRHKNIQMLITSHLINGIDRELTRTIHNELDTMTIFPQGANIYQVTFNLQNYWGLTPKQIRKIMNTDSHWVTLFKKHPQLMLTEYKICFLSDLKM